jgi:hypothetical protein
MGVTSEIKNWINAVLSPVNLRLETRTAERIETARLAGLVANGHFAKPAFPILPQFANCDPSNIADAICRFKDDTRRFCDRNRQGYCFHNDFFMSPDAEVAYAMARTLRPRRIIEVGSGNSTQLFREAIDDAHSQTELVAIDPSPTKAIREVADRTIQARVEDTSLSWFEDLQPNDVLFIDSSHLVSTGNDVVHLLLNIVPKLRTGVVLHFHDIFLPYDYPQSWVTEDKLGYSEQYLVQASLQNSDGFEVLWPGHFLQKTWTRFADLFEPRPKGQPPRYGCERLLNLLRATIIKSYN